MGVSIAIVLLTTELHRASMALRDSVASVALADGAQLELLMHERARDSVVRLELENDLRRRLSDARRYVTSPQEQAALDAATLQVDGYLSAERDDTSSANRTRVLESTYAALETLAGVNVEQANAAVLESTRMDTAGNVPRAPE